MIVITGGAYQGKGIFARTLGFTNEKILYNAHEIIRDAMRDGKEAAEELNTRLAGKSVITCDEIGMGIVPQDGFEREWRESVGRIMCDISRDADTVYRVVCGIGIKIKG